MLIPSYGVANNKNKPSLSRRVNANSQPGNKVDMLIDKLIKKGECQFPAVEGNRIKPDSSLSRRVNANSQLVSVPHWSQYKLIKKGEC